MTTLPSAADLVALEAPHVARATFVDVQLASGRRRFHSGVGTVTIGGHEWEGVNDPFGGQLVSIGQIVEPRLGEAPSIDVVFSGANREWFRQLATETIEGTPCDVYWAMFDGETGEVILDLRLLFRGRLSAPTLSRVGLALRDVSVTIESVYVGLQYPVPEMEWTTASQRRRYPGDRGLDWLGSDLIEVWRP